MPEAIGHQKEQNWNKANGWSEKFIKLEQSRMINRRRTTEEILNAWSTERRAKQNKSILGANAFQSFYSSAEFWATSSPSLVEDHAREQWNAEQWSVCNGGMRERPQSGNSDLKIRTRDKFTFGDVEMKTHRISNVDNSLDVLCNCLFRTTQSKIVQIAQIQVGREKSLSTPGWRCRTRADQVGRSCWGPSRDNNMWEPKKRLEGRQYAE